MNGQQESGRRWQDWGKATRPALAILSTAFLATAVLALRGNSCGDDFDFHLLSWMEAARSWRSGVLYPHWIHFANYGAGEPRFVFYPPLSWMLGGLLGRASTWGAAPILFVLLALVACGASMYRLAREWAPRGAATVAACLYAGNPYALFVIYQRSALAELLAGAWIPLIVLFALKRDSAVAALALAVAAVWLTDAPAAVMAAYLLAFLALGMTLLERQAWPALRAAGGMTLGLGLAAFYIVPAFYQQGWVEIERSITPGMRVADSFLFMRTGNSYHDHVLRAASWIVCLEGTVAVIAAVTVIAARRPRSGAPHDSAERAAAQSASPRRHAQAALIALLPVLLLLQLPASEPWWNHAPWLRFVQFPWRWLMVLGVAACTLIALALDALQRKTAGAKAKYPAWRKASGASVVAGSIVFGSVVFGSMVIGIALLFFQPCDEEDAVSAQVSAFQGNPAAAHIEGTDEYTPRGADNSKIQQGLPLVRLLAAPAGSSLAAGAAVKEDDAEHWEIQLTGSAPGYAVLRLMDYPAWRVTDNGKIAGNRPHREDGLMTIPVVQGVNKIDVRWSDPGDALAGRVISEIALALLAAAFLEGRRRRQRHRLS